MGTMIQQHRLDEAGYRGERFAEGYDDSHFAEGEAHAHGPGCGCAGDLKGNNDLLTLTQPRDHPRRSTAPTSRPAPT